MKIGKYKKDKKNLYKVEIDNQDYLLYDDIIIKYELLLKKEITKDYFNELIKENKSLECYYKALNYLEKKMATRIELVKYLEKDYPVKDINIACDKLECEKYLDDDRYIKAYINDSIRFKNDGPEKITNNLEKLGLPKDKITSYLKNITEEEWLTKLDKLINKKVNSNHKDSKYMLLNKIKSGMLNLGYPMFMIESSLKNINITNDESILLKEYNKEKRKLEKKYSGKELEYKISTKLRMKGYSTDEIDYLKNI